MLPAYGREKEASNRVRCSRLRARQYSLNGDGHRSDQNLTGKVPPTRLHSPEIDNRFKAVGIRTARSG